MTRFISGLCIDSVTYNLRSVHVGVTRQDHTVGMDFVALMGIWFGFSLVMVGFTMARP